MSHLIRDLQLVDARGRKYRIADARQRFLEAACLAPRPADQTFALTLAHTGARVSEALAVRPMDIVLEAASIRIRTLKRRAEHWPEVPVPPELLRALELVHALRSTPAKAEGEPLCSGPCRGRPPTGRSPEPWPTPTSRAPRHPRRSSGIATIAADVPLPTITAALGNANLQTIAVYITDAGLAARFSGQDMGKGGEFGPLRLLKGLRGEGT